MPPRNIAPTRSNLLRTRESLELAREGHDILDKKREVLTNELIHVAHDAAQLQKEVWAQLEEAYQALQVARVSTGREHLEWAALSAEENIEVEVIPHSVMGVVIPSIKTIKRPTGMAYSLGDTTVPLDEAAARFQEVLDQIPELTEIMTTVWRLARELQKTQRRVNALEHVFIPQYEQTVKFIEEALEEREREETFRMKRIKSGIKEEPSIGPKRREYQQPHRDVSGGRSRVHPDPGGGKPTTREFG